MSPVGASFYLQVVSFNNVIAITNNVIPILLSFYLGSWSDQFGRLPFLGLYMIGRTLSALANFLNAVYLKELGKWVWCGKKDQSFPNSTHYVMFSSLYRPVVYTIFTE